jgi:uncharacterized repeat protein (TIGR03803 family)
MFTIRKSGTSMILAVALWLCASGPLPAQTFTALYKFGSGGPPTAGLVEGTDGNLYGTTYGYSGKQNGMIFKITPSGTFTTLHSGGAFAAGLILGNDGNFYGTSLAGGTVGYGWVFKITPSGTLTTLHNFGRLPSGTYPSAALVQASDGNFYGTTKEGGTNSCLYGGTNFGCGTLFRITPSGTLTTLYTFCSQSGCADGQEPGGLVRGADGNLYGTTGAGGNGVCGSSGGCGTIFKITTTGTLTTLHSFDRADGALPTTLVQHSNGTFYGTTVRGGANVYHACGGWCGTIFSLSVGLGPFVETEPASGNVGRPSTF